MELPLSLYTCTFTAFICIVKYRVKLDTPITTDVPHITDKHTTKGCNREYTSKVELITA